MNNKKKFLYSKVFLAISIVLLLSLVVLSFVQFVNVGKLFEKKVEQKYNLVDQCAPLKGYGFIHQIKTEGDCSNKCVSECISRGLEKTTVEFSLSTDSCNTCTCYCK
jgi:hypothetical protein